MRENFRPAGEVDYAAFASQPPSFTQTKSTFTPSHKLGLQYERRVQDHLVKLCSKHGGFICIPNPWIMFHRVGESSSTINFCQPDCLLIDNRKEERKIIIIECKYSHTGDSWTQIRKLYEPLVRKLYPEFKIACVEICKWYDPHTAVAFPETFYYCENVLEAVTNRFGIHIYKPRGRKK